ncbi:MAG: hypothetical protein A2X79_04145 [Desulfuromonadaceae bacterium GWB2_53_15]|nr:MAG: hypothetical protein A2X79_04145 [Desulfuromonadaceae bacterium GWB2_53_15]
MKKLLVLACLAASVSMTSGTAMADSIKGRLGLTGKIGMLVPADSDYRDSRIKPDVGFVGGGGLLYGIDDHFAAEIDVTRTEFGSDFPRSGSAGDFGITDIAIGMQYRFEVAHKKLVPYVGAGLDILLSDYDHPSGSRHDVDTTVGIHGRGGVDYFIHKQVAVMAELNLLSALDTDIKNSTGAQGNFNPSSVSSIVGFRLFFN